MTKLHMLFTKFMLLVLLATQPSLAFAQDIPDTGDFLTLKKGQVSPFDGYLFDSRGLINIMVNKSLEIQQITIKKDSEINKLNIEIEALKKTNELVSKLSKEASENIIKLKEDRIKILEDGNKWDDVKTYGALSLGIILSVVIFFAAVQIQKL